MERIRKYVEELDSIFKRTHDKREANYQSRRVLEDMSGDAALLGEVLERHVRVPGCLDATHYPVLGIDIELNPYYGLVANCWIPLPDRKADISTKSIHHHGNMLLSTVTAFGPGYEHWTFTRPTPVDRAADLYEMKLIESAPHPQHHVAFVDSYIAHLPFYPPGTSVTYALWTNKFPVTWKDHVKRFQLLQKNSETLRKLAVRAGLARQLDLKVVEYFDFYPTPEGFRGIKERTEFERGPNEDYLYSLFHVIQATGNEHLGSVIREQLDRSGPHSNSQLISSLLDDLHAGRPVEGRLSPMHFGVDRANFTRSDVEASLAAQSESATTWTPNASAKTPRAEAADGR